MSLYKNIRLLRKIFDLHQEDIAFELGITQSYYSRIEREKVNIPFIIVEKISDFYNIPIEILAKKDLEQEPQLIPKKTRPKS